MILTFSPRPGPRERQLARRWNNPLFGGGGNEVTQAQIDAAAHRDREDLAAFMERLQALVQEAVALKPNEESERILDLKARLDRAYTEAAGLPGDQGAVMEALGKLIDVVMRAVRAGAQGDPQALQELEGEAQARQVHFRLLKHPLVADLMRPDSPIDRRELVPTLLSEEPEALEAALWLFEPGALREMHREARALLERLRDTGHEAPAAWQNLMRLERAASQTEEE